jgi:hypothetical protein
VKWVTPHHSLHVQPVWQAAHINKLLKGVWTAVALSILEFAKLQGRRVEAASDLVRLSRDDVKAGPRVWEDKAAKGEQVDHGGTSWGGVVAVDVYHGDIGDVGEAAAYTRMRLFSSTVHRALVELAVGNLGWHAVQPFLSNKHESVHSHSIDGMRTSFT